MQFSMGISSRVLSRSHFTRCHLVLLINIPRPPVKPLQCCVFPHLHAKAWNAQHLAWQYKAKPLKRKSFCQQKVQVILLTESAMLNLNQLVPLRG